MSYGLKKQLLKLTQKWVLLEPNKALAKSGFKDQNWSHLEEGSKPLREKRKRKRRGSSSKTYKVWKLNLCMDSMRLCMNFHALMVILLPKSRVFVRVSS